MAEHFLKDFTHFTPCSLQGRYGQINLNILNIKVCWRIKKGGGWWGRVFHQKTKRYPPKSG